MKLKNLSSILLVLTLQSKKITCSHVFTFIEVGLNEGQKLIYYMGNTGFIKSTISRHMSELELYGWIKSNKHKKDGRARQYYLTIKGKAMLNAFEALMN